MPSAGNEMFQKWGLNSWSWESSLGYGGTGDYQSLVNTFPRGMLQEENFKNEH